MEPKVVCVERGGYAPLFIQRVKVVLLPKFGTNHMLHRLYMAACNRQSKQSLGGVARGQPPLGVSRPLTESVCHRLRLAGLGPGVDQGPVVLRLFWAGFEGRLLGCLCKSACRKVPFGEILHVFVFVTCKIIFSKYMWNLVIGKCICELVC